MYCVCLHSKAYTEQTGLWSSNVLMLLCYYLLRYRMHTLWRYVCVWLHSSVCLKSKCASVLVPQRHNTIMSDNHTNAMSSLNCIANSCTLSCITSLGIPIGPVTAAYPEPPLPDWWDSITYVQHMPLSCEAQSCDSYTPYWYAHHTTCRIASHDTPGCAGGIAAHTPCDIDVAHIAVYCMLIGSIAVCKWGMHVFQCV